MFFGLSIECLKNSVAFSMAKNAAPSIEIFGCSFQDDCCLLNGIQNAAVVESGCPFLLPSVYILRKFLYLCSMVSKVVCFNNFTLIAFVTGTINSVYTLSNSSQGAMLGYLCVPILGLTGFQYPFACASAGFSIPFSTPLSG